MENSLPKINKILLRNTSHQYDNAIKLCRNVFHKKTSDYGTAWRILRPTSMTDQLYIKACRIRSIEQKKNSRINEPVLAEYIGLVNYSIMALIQLERQDDENIEIETQTMLEWYEDYIQKAKLLMEDKNHDYGEAWRDMRISSITDLILMKLLRIKSIENNGGKTLISEGLDANYLDILNYAVFAIILLEENKTPNK